MIIKVETEQGTLTWTPNPDSELVRLYSEYPDLCDGHVLSMTLTKFFSAPFANFLVRLERALLQGPKSFRNEMTGLDRLAANLIPAGLGPRCIAAGIELLEERRSA